MYKIINLKPPIWKSFTWHIHIQFLCELNGCGQDALLGVKSSSLPVVYAQDCHWWQKMVISL